MIGSTVDGRFLLLGLLGQGGMGRVYEARDMTTGGRVAVKVLSLQPTAPTPLSARLSREAAATTRAASRHIVRLLHSGVDAATHTLYVVTECLSGADLDHWMRTLGPLAPELALRIATQACLGLESVHAVGLVHRDIKPSNLFLDEVEGGERIVKILDFGLAKLQAGAPAVTDWGVLTHTGMLLGTPLYMSPEQARGGKEIDHRSDLWSLGVVLYRALTGRAPHEGLEGMGELIIAICQGRAEPVEQLAPWVPPGVSALVKKALEPDPAHRFQSAAEMREALGALLVRGSALDVSMFVSRDPMRRAAAQGPQVPPGPHVVGPQEQTLAPVPESLQPTRIIDPPARAGETPALWRSQLPAPVNRLVGRERETTELKRSISSSRLVTLLGPGGTGKTRLALHVVSGLGTRFEHGAGFVDLSPLTDPRAIPQAIAGALGLREEPGQSLEGTLAVQLRARHLLLVLDNCEHLVESCASYVEQLLAACPRLWIIATSREALAVAGELTFLVSPLPVPAHSVEEPFERIARSDAVLLFVERAQAVDPAFLLTQANAGPVAHICRQLDGIPLALELAAARIRAMSVEQLSEQINDRFRLLSGVRRGVSRRQQTLRALIDWSHDLLTPPERMVLRRLSVFQGGFSLEAVEAICTDPGEPLGVTRAQVFELLYALVSKSLVLAGRQEGRDRYRLLETLRHYARDKLQEAGEEARLQARHFDYFLQLAEETEPALQRDTQLTCLGRLEAEHGNLRAALDSCDTAPERAERGLRLAGALGLFWWLRGHHSEGRALLERVLARSTGSPSPARAKALCQLGLLLPGLQQAHPVWKEALDFYRQEGHARGVAFALIGVIGWEAQRGNREQVLPLVLEGIARAREAGDSWLLARHQDELGLYHLHRKEGSEAARLLEEGLALARSVGERWLMGLLLNSLSLVVSFQGDYARARVLLLECLELHEALGFKRGKAETLASLGGILQLLGDFPASDQCFEQTVVIALSLGSEELAAKAYLNLAENALISGKAALSRPFMKEFFERATGLMHKELLAWGLLIVAVLARRDGDLEHALHFFAAEQTLEEAFRINLHPQWRRSYDETLEAVRHELGDKSEHVWSAGRRLQPEQALQSALAYVAA